MLFSSIIFIFVFLPTVLLIYYLCFWNRKIQNVFLCLASLFFYAWGEPKFVLIMMTSIVINWAFGLAVEKHRKARYIKALLFADVLANLSIIFVFKYLGFTVSNLNHLFSSSITVPDIALPIGISFFTFQAISYVIDVYRQKGEAQKNILNVGLYISFFPQLIAGPIVRYETIAMQINDRHESLADFSYGVRRFIIGLGKKVLIANNMALIADKAFALSAGTDTWFGVEADMVPMFAWLGAIAYTFQIFFDFSGYSDMAIGLGKMFGFHFLENFNYPYISKSATEFWRRWHMSLSSWFRDYVYIPLGGSRVDTKRRHYFNIFVVWLCTGVWHGANWTFIAWGMMYFILLVFEKATGLYKESDRLSVNILKHIYTMFFVIIGWVFFRADSITDALIYLQHMFDVQGLLEINDPLLFYIRQFGVFLIAAAIFSTPIVKKIEQKTMCLDSKNMQIIASVVEIVVISCILVSSISFIVVGSYNPFIYFNF